MMFLLIVLTIISLQIAGTINKLIRDMGLRELGQLEQDLVFGDAGAKDVINFLRTKQVMPWIGGQITFYIVQLIFTFSF